LLGIEPFEATSDLIKSEYRRLALRYHPDKHVNSTADVKKAAEKKFIEVNVAYTVLKEHLTQKG